MAQLSFFLSANILCVESPLHRFITVFFIDLVVFLLQTNPWHREEESLNTKSYKTSTNRTL